MSRVTLLRGARQLLTFRGEKSPRRGAAMQQIGLIQDGAILIRDGVIDQVGPARRVENLAAARDAEVLDAHRRVVMPAFVDQQIARAAYPFENELQFARASSAGRLHARWKRPVNAGVRHGTGTLVLHWPVWEDPTVDQKVLRAMAALREDGADLLSGVIFEHPHSSWWDFARLAQRHVLHSVIAVCRVPAVSAQMESFLRATARAGLRTHLRCTRECGIRLELHDEVDVVSCAGGTPISIPAGSRAIGLATQDSPSTARQWLDEGAAVALATFYDRNAPGTYSLQMAVYRACIEMRLSIEEALVASTINAAWAAGVGERTGSLEPGKSADLLILEMTDYREFLSCPGVNNVFGMIKNGEPV